MAQKLARFIPCCLVSCIQWCLGTFCIKARLFPGYSFSMIVLTRLPSTNFPKNQVVGLPFANFANNKVVPDLAHVLVFYETFFVFVDEE